MKAPPLITVTQRRRVRRGNVVALDAAIARASGRRDSLGWPEGVAKLLRGAPKRTGGNPR